MPKGEGVRGGEGLVKGVVKGGGREGMDLNIPVCFWGELVGAGHFKGGGWLTRGLAGLVMDMEE